jgi:hypothetical protein
MENNKSGKVIVNEDYVVKWVFIDGLINVQLYKHGKVVDAIQDQIIETKN